MNNAEANLDNLGEGKVVYDDMPSYAAQWLEIYRGRQGTACSTCRSDRPSTSAFPDQRVADPPRRSQTGNAEIYALGRSQQIVGGDDRSPRSGQNTGSNTKKCPRSGWRIANTTSST